MNISRSIFLSVGLLTVVACEDLYSPTMRPDYTIHVAKTPQGMVAIPPECPSWSDAVANPFDNQPLPQFGCATSRNLASQIENPKDLVEGRPLGDARGVTLVGSVRRYDNNQPRGLVMPVAETSQIAVTSAPTASSTITGDPTGENATKGNLTKTAP